MYIMNQTFITIVQSNYNYHHYQNRNRYQKYPLNDNINNMMVDQDKEKRDREMMAYVRYKVFKDMQRDKKVEEMIKCQQGFNSMKKRWGFD